MATIGTLIISFFRNHLINEQDVSKNTISSYSDCIRLLMNYASEKLQVSIDKLALDAISDTMILDFLDFLENERANTPTTRNQRLAAIKTFFRFLARHEPTLIVVCERICAIRGKKTEHKLFLTLETDEVEAVLQAPDNSILNGARDAVLLGMFYNTGARNQELVDLNLPDFRLDDLKQVTLTGKGRKQRIVPIWDETIKAIKHYLELRRQAGIHSEVLFLNARGERITRFGVNHIINKHVLRAAQECESLQNKHVTAHTFRHTVALHMVQAKIDIVKIKELLGHASIRTTSKYVEIDMNMKREAIEKATIRTQQPQQCTEHETSTWRIPLVLTFLKQLSTGAALC